MKLLLKLGLKNLGRKKSRSFLTISAVVLCSAGIMMYSVLMEGAIDMMMDGLIDQIGHYRVVHEKVIKEPRLSKGSYFVGDAKRLIQDIKKIPGVVTVAPRVELGAFIDNTVKNPKTGKIEGKQAPGPGLGIDPEVEKNVLKLDKSISKGRMIRSTGKEIVLGFRLADRLNAKVGDSLVLIGKTVDDSMSALRVKVVGIVTTGTVSVDKMFFVSLKSAQYFLDIPNQLSSLLVFGRDRRAGDSLKAPLSKVQMPKRTMAQSWKQNSFGQMMGMANIFMFIIGGFVVFIAGVGLMNTMTMSVLERRDEVGIMMALGFTPGKVAGVFLTEGLVLGSIGAMIGVILASLASIPMITTGVSFGTEAVSKLPFPIQQTMKGAITMNSIMIGLAVGVLATIVGTLWPAIQASRMDPVEALRD
ncbi:MAG: ABC transporter permease [Deltaproteobacteria bacterium]|nr:MAG: ABC transporter permease [Deltaproteobacteria bacterium]